jgi:ankyrin repeat protein
MIDLRIIINTQTDIRAIEPLILKVDPTETTFQDVILHIKKYIESLSADAQVPNRPCAYYWDRDSTLEYDEYDEDSREQEYGGHFFRHENVCKNLDELGMKGEESLGSIYVFLYIERNWISDLQNKDARLYRRICEYLPINKSLGEMGLEEIEMLNKRLCLSSTPFELGNLPGALLCKSLSNLSLKELVNLKLVSRKFSGLIQNPHRRIMDILAQEPYTLPKNSLTSPEKRSQANDLREALEYLLLIGLRSMRSAKENKIFNICEFLHPILAGLFVNVGTVEALVSGLAAVLRQPVKEEKGRAEEAQISDPICPEALMQRLKKGHSHIVACLPGMSSDAMMLQTLVHRYRYADDKDTQRLMGIKWTKLALAAYEGCTEEVGSLCQTELCIDDFRIALCVAVERGHIAVFELLLQKAPQELEMHSMMGNALFVAVEKGYTAVIAALLEKAPEMISLENGDHEDLLYLCAKNADSPRELVDLLCKITFQQGDFLTRSRSLARALQRAVQISHVYMVERLISFKLEKEHLTHWRDDAEGLVSALAIENKGGLLKEMEVVELFLQQLGAQITSVRSSFAENNLIHIAARRNTTDMLERILKLPLVSSWLNEKNRSGDFPIHYATEFTIGTLVTKGANVNEKDGYGKTALHIAAAAGKLSVVDQLLALNANVNEKDNNGETALQVAARRHIAAAAGKPSVVAQLLAFNANVNEQNKDGATALHMAAAEGNLSVVDQLLAFNANVNEQHKDGVTALHLAVAKGSLSVVDQLLKAKADVHKQNNEGETALHFAARFAQLVKYEKQIDGYRALIEALIEKSASPSALNGNNQTPLHVAVETKDFHMVKIFLDKGFFDYSSYHYAQQCNDGGVLGVFADYFCRKSVKLEAELLKLKAERSEGNIAQGDGKPKRLASSLSELGLFGDNRGDEPPAKRQCLSPHGMGPSAS